MTDLSELISEEEPCTCGRYACEGVRTWQADPFVAEIHGETVMIFACGAEIALIADEI